jgi:peptide chain release factor 2
MCLEAKDENLLSEVEKDFITLDLDVQDAKIELLLSGPNDSRNCFIDINAGSGGTESHDWAGMMIRMYLRFAEKLGFKAHVVSLIDGEEAGIKSCTISVQGHNAYGWLKTESGVHRLVRISPFNAAGKRMTSFSSCWVYPEVDDDIDISVEEKDLRIDTYRASGAGGQHVNTTDSAVRITHIPTNIVVTCQNERSQHKNKASAMKMLKAKLHNLEIQKREAEINLQNASKSENSWGHQIRSYVLQPYQMVKDLRTDYESSDIQKVLDGELKDFVTKALSQRF